MNLLFAHLRTQRTSGLRFAARALLLLLPALLISCCAWATTYSVTNDTTWNSVPWCTLQPGDTVNISPKPNDAPYFQKLDLTAQGTSSAWITVTGVPGPAVNATDLQVNATVNTIVTSASYAFTAYDVNNLLTVTGGSGWTPGWYQIINVTGGAATLATSPAPAGTSGGQWNKTGHLPIIDGTNAVTSPNMCPYGAQQYHEGLGLVVTLAPSNWNGTTNTAVPSYLKIAYLRVQNAHATNSFTAAAGTTQAYQAGTAGIYMQHCYACTADHVEITNNDNGLFTNYNTGNYSPTLTTNITLQYSHVWGNGLAASFLYHNAYSESNGITYQYNWLEETVGAAGGLIKDRSAGGVFAYNWFGNAGPAHVLDLDECENGCTAPANGNTVGNWPGTMSLPTYRQTFVYGNVFFDVPYNYAMGGVCGTTSSFIQYGYDNTPAQDRAGTLYFYNNTTVMAMNMNITTCNAYYTTLFSLITNNDTVDARNNLWYVTDYSNSLGATILDWDDQNVATGGPFGVINFGNNWVSPGWVLSKYTPTATINGTTNFTSPGTNSPSFAGFSAWNYVPLAASSSAGIGGALASQVTSNALGQDFTPKWQISQPMAVVARTSYGVGSAAGAFAAAGGAAPSLSITTTSLSQGTANSAYSAMIAATGGVAPYSWSLASGALPTGLSLSSSGTLSGTPTTAGIYQFSVTVTDSTSPSPQTATQSYTLTIAAASGNGGSQNTTQVTILNASATQTQLILRYRAPTSNQCTVSVTDNSGDIPSVNDVNNALFPGANLDTSRTAANGFKWPVMTDFVAPDGSQIRTLILGGHGEVKKGSDGAWYSTALQSATAHTVTLSCNGGAATTSLTIKTDTPKVGNSFSEPPPVDLTYPLGHMPQPTIDFSSRTKSYIDPFTGVEVRLVTTPLDNMAGYNDSTLKYALDRSGGQWSNPSNALTNQDSSHLATTSTPGAGLFLAWPTLGEDGASFRVGTTTTIDIKGMLYGTGTNGGTAQVCISVDSGQTCASDNTLTQTLTSSPVQYNLPASGYPSAGFIQWGNKGLKLNSYNLANGPPLSGINVSGSVLTNPSPSGIILFNTDRAPGSKFQLSNCTSGLVGTNTYTVASADSPTQITAQETIGTATGCTYTDLGAGFLVTMKNTGGSPSISVSMTVENYVSSSNGTNTPNGSANICSTVKVTDITTDCDGNAQNPALSGEMCMLGNQIYLLQDNGRMCLQSSLYNPGVGYMAGLLNPWSNTDPHVFSVTNYGNNHLYRATMSKSGNYQEYQPGPGSNPPDGVSYYDVTLNATPLATQLAACPSCVAANTAYQSNLMGSFGISGVIGGNIIWGAQPGGQDTACLRAVTDLNGTLLSARTSWDSYPMRWGACHFGPFGSGNYYLWTTKPATAYNTAVNFGGPFTLQVLALRRNGVYQQYTQTITAATNGNPGLFSVPNHQLDQYWIENNGNASRGIGPLVYIAGGTGNWAAANGTWIAVPNGASQNNTGNDPNNFYLIDQFTKTPLNTSSFGSLTGTLSMTAAPPLTNTYVQSVAGSPALVTVSGGIAGNSPYSTNHRFQNGDSISFGNLGDQTAYYAKTSCTGCDATHFQVYADSGLTTPVNASTLSTAANGYVYQVEACPSGLPSFLTTNMLFDSGAYNPAIRCVTVLVNGEPCSIFGDLEHGTYPCPSDPTNTKKSSIQQIALGDAMSDAGRLGYGETMVVVAKNTLSQSYLFTSLMCL